MAKENQASIEDLAKHVEFVGNELIKTNDRIVLMLQNNVTLASNVNTVLATVISKSPPTDQNVPPESVNYDSHDFDEILNKKVDDSAVENAIYSRVYKGRIVSIEQTKGGSITIHQQSHHLRQTNENYRPTRLDLSPETFMLILEAMEFAEKQFGMDRKAILQELTGGKELIFEKGTNWVR